MTDFILIAIFFAGLALGWAFVNRRMKAKDRGWFLRHFAGSSAGFVAGFVAFTIAFVIIGPETSPASDAIATTTNEPKAAMEGQDDISSLYIILRDETKPPHKRTVEVQLNQRVDEAKLRAIGKAIKAEGEQGVERTFIGYRLASQTPESTFWGTTNYNPEIKVNISGLTPYEMQALLTYDAESEYENIIGSWIIERGFNYIAVAYAKEGKVYIDDVFPGEGVNTTEFTISKLDQGGIRLQQSDDTFGEYFTIAADGKLRFWSENGNYFTAAPRSADQVDLALSEAS